MTPTLVPPFTQDLGILCHGDNAKLSHGGKGGSRKKYCIRRGMGQGHGVNTPDHIGLPALNTGPRSKSSVWRVMGCQGGCVSQGGTGSDLLLERPPALSKVPIDTHPQGLH